MYIIKPILTLMGGRNCFFDCLIDIWMVGGKLQIGGYNIQQSSTVVPILMSCHTERYVPHVCVHGWGGDNQIYCRCFNIKQFIVDPFDTELHLVVQGDKNNQHASTRKR